MSKRCALRRGLCPGPLPIGCPFLRSDCPGQYRLIGLLWQAIIGRPGQRTESLQQPQAPKKQDV
jgi:hypothetical protein